MDRDGPGCRRVAHVEKPSPPHIRAARLEAIMLKSRIALICVLLLAVSGCGGSDRSSPLSSGSLIGSLSVQSTDLGTLPRNPSIVGRDGGYSASFQGSSVWLYGDTFLNAPNAVGHTSLTNSWSYTT